MNGKRGLSPLIATVLLIGFAVALGVMIMSLTQPIKEGSCDDVNFKTVSFCREGTKIIPLDGEGKTACRDLAIDIDKIPDRCPTA